MSELLQAKAEIRFDLSCKKCGSPLGANKHGPFDGAYELHVYPCEKCLKSVADHPQVGIASEEDIDDIEVRLAPEGLPLNQRERVFRVLSSARITRALVPLVRQMIECAVPQHWSCTCPGGPKECAFDKVEKLMDELEGK